MLVDAGVTIADYIMVYMSLYFGRAGGPGNWGSISSLIAQFVAPHRPKNAHTHAPESFEDSQFAEDGDSTNRLSG